MGFWLLAICFAFVVIINYAIFGPISGILLSIIYLLIVCYRNDNTDYSVKAIKPKERPTAESVVKNNYSAFITSFIETKRKNPTMSDSTAWTISISEQLAKLKIEYDIEFFLSMRQQLKKMERVDEGKE